MGKKEETSAAGKAEAVMELLRKQSPLSVKQEKFCNNACVERFLKAKGNSVKKAAKHLRACLSWRHNFATESLIADEFSAELAEGTAYVAGHDDESRPVMLFRIKQDYQKFHSQKLLTRLLVFTLEVGIGTMPKNVEQFVLLFDASFFRSASAFMNLLVSSLKIVGDYYPGMLFKAFVIDPPSLFSYLWKGVGPFVELSTVTNVVSSLEFEEESVGFHDLAPYYYPSPSPRDCSSLRFEPNTTTTTNTKSNKVIGSSCSSSRFSFTVSNHHLDSLKPWHLTLTSEPSFPKVGPSPPLGPALISPLNARSLSFASPGMRRSGYGGHNKKSLFPSTPLPKRPASMGMEELPRRGGGHSRTPKPSFLQSPATFFMRKADKTRESFAPFAKFYRRPYDEMIYRSKMRPPLGGLISIVSPHIRRRHHMSVSQRF